MKTISTLLVSAALFTCMTGLTSCNKATKVNNAAAESIEKGSADTKIAYIEIDTIISQYQFCKDYSKVLTKRGQSIQATLSSKGQALQNAAEQFQKKVQQGGFASQDQAAQVQASLQRQQGELQSLQEKYSQQFEKERQKYNNEMRDSIQSFLKEYNKSHNYSIILSKADDNILLADKSMDITNDVLAGLNKRYKPGKAVSGK